MADENDVQRQKERGDASLLLATNMQETPDKGVSRREFVGLAAASIFFSQMSPQTAASESKNGIPYRTLGRTREKVSLIGLGGYHLGKQVDQQESIRIIRTGYSPAGPLASQGDNRRARSAGEYPHYSNGIG